MRFPKDGGEPEHQGERLPGPGAEGAENGQRGNGQYHPGSEKGAGPGQAPAAEPGKGNRAVERSRCL